MLNEVPGTRKTSTNARDFPDDIIKAQVGGLKSVFSDTSQKVESHKPTGHAPNTLGDLLCRFCTLRVKASEPRELLLHNTCRTHWKESAGAQTMIIHRTTTRQNSPLD